MDYWENSRMIIGCYFWEKKLTSNVEWNYTARIERYNEIKAKIFYMVEDSVKTNWSGYCQRAIVFIISKILPKYTEGKYGQFGKTEICVHDH